MMYCYFKANHVPCTYFADIVSKVHLSHTLHNRPNIYRIAKSLNAPCQITR